jgi:hypothetical protein
MLKRFAPLVPLALVTLLFGCAAHSPVSQQEQQQQFKNSMTAQSSSVLFQEELYQDGVATDKELANFADGKSYQLPVLADSILERGMSLIGTRYCFVNRPA